MYHNYEPCYFAWNASAEQLDQSQFPTETLESEERGKTHNVHLVPETGKDSQRSVNEGGLRLDCRINEKTQKRGNEASTQAGGRHSLCVSFFFFTVVAVFQDWPLVDRLRCFICGIPERKTEYERV